MEFDAWARAQGAEPLHELEFMPRANAANLFLYPPEVDYRDARPLDESWSRMDSSVRETDGDYEVPARVADRPEDSGHRADGAGWVDIGLGRHRARDDHGSQCRGKLPRQASPAAQQGL